MNGSSTEHTIARSAITRGSCVFNKHEHRIMHLYANKIYAREEHHAMILVSWIETFICISGLIIQMKPMKWWNNNWQTNPADGMQK